MILKERFGKYKAKDVDAYIEEIKSANQQEVNSFKQYIKKLEEKIALLENEITEYKAKESIVAQALIDATKHAKEIEEDCRTRAKQSDEACKKLNDEWIGGMQSAQANLESLKNEAKKILDQIDDQFSNLCSWADNRLESLERAQLPSKNSENISDEIISGAGADLGDLCAELGYSENATEAVKDENTDIGENENK